MLEVHAILQRQRCNENITKKTGTLSDAYVYMSDRQQFIIDCTSLIPVIGTLVLIKIANEQMVTMVAAYVLCGELLGVLISRILRLYYIDVAFVWLGGIMLWLWYWFGVQPSYMG